MQATTSNKLRITLEDVNSPQVDAKLKERDMVLRTSEHYETAQLPTSTLSLPRFEFLYNTLVYMGLFGLLGGLLGWDRGLTTLWNIATPAAAVLLVFLATSLLYWLGPNVKMQLRYVGPGALLFVTAWILFSLGFAFYIGNFSNYNRVYGSLAAVIILAGLVAIPRDIEEAARVDGAGWWRRMFEVTIPLTLPVVAVAALFGAILTFTDMTVVYVLTRGGPTNSTQVLASWAFIRGIEGGDVAQGAAVALFLFPLLLAAAIAILRAVRRLEVL